MIHYKILGGILSLGVGCAIIGGITHAVVSQDPNSTGWNTYFVVVSDSKETTNKTSCLSRTDCLVYKSNSSFSSFSDFKKIYYFGDVKPKLQYMIQTNKKLADTSKLIEVEFESGKKLLFQVKSEASLNKENKIKPVLPTGIVDKDKLEMFALGKTFSNLSKEQKDSWKYHFENYPTRIEREQVNHEEFLVFNWHRSKTLNKGGYLLDHESSKIDKYLFTTKEEQLHDPIAGGNVSIDINSKEQSSNLLLEIYEIKDQESLKRVFDNKKNQDEHFKFVPENIKWDEIAQENVMVTKFTALEEGKYYKFVINNYKNFAFKSNDADKTGITSLNIKKTWSNNLTQKIMEFELDSAAPLINLCSYIKGNEEQTYCKEMKEKKR